MDQLLITGENDPLGAMLLDYLHGCRGAAVEVISSTFEMSVMSGEVMFRGYREMDALERCGLGQCTGHVLDVGGGSGCHSLWLQEKVRRVTTLDISRGAVEVMMERGVMCPLHENFFTHPATGYDTILMLMNGLGICGTLEGLGLLLRKGRELLRPGGFIVADSTDLQPLYTDQRPEQEWQPSLGETEFVMRYGDIVSEPFPWLYVDYATLAAVAGENGLDAECLLTLPDQRYLARLSS